MPEYTVREKYVSEGTTFDMHEDGFVVARKPHLSGAKLLIAEPAKGAEYKCRAKKSDGVSLCQRTVVGPEERCWQHD